MKKLPRNLLNLLYLILGTITMILGIIGIVLPVLPTVPFFLLTAFLYAKGSKRFHVRFINSKLYTRFISGLAEHHTMSLGGELFLLIFVSLMLLTATLMFADNLFVAIILPTLDLLKYTYFILRIKTLSRGEIVAMRQKILLEKSQLLIVESKDEE